MLDSWLASWFFSTGAHKHQNKNTDEFKSFYAKYNHYCYASAQTTIIFPTQPSYCVWSSIQHMVHAEIVRLLSIHTYNMQISSIWYNKHDIRIHSHTDKATMTSQSHQSFNCGIKTGLIDIPSF